MATDNTARTEVNGDHYFWMGCCLFAVQAVESALASAIEVVLPRHGMISVESMESDEADHRRKTVGQLVRKLNERARIDPGVADRLESFLNRRNEFVHHFVHKFDLGTESGRSEAIEFCRELALDAFSLGQLFHGIVFAVYDALETRTGGEVKADWDSMPPEVAQRLREIARFLPAIIRERKSQP